MKLFLFGSSSIFDETILEFFFYAQQYFMQSHLSTTSFPHPQFSVDEVVCAQTHSMKFDISKVDELDLFYRLYSLVKRLIEDQKYFQKIFSATDTSKNSNQSIPSGREGSECSEKCSFKKMQVFSIAGGIMKDQIDESDVIEQHNPKNESTAFYNANVNPAYQNLNKVGEQKRLRNTKKISILIMQEQLPSFPDSQNLISNSQIPTLRELLIPQLEFNIQTIKLIYDSPSPFIINLSLCLFIRYITRANPLPKLNECSWILCIATMIAYKLYYDEELQGILECFREVMGVKKKDIIDLQRCFLTKIEYETVIRGGMYHFVMSQLLKAEGKPTKHIGNTVSNGDAKIIQERANLKLQADTFAQF